MLGLLHSLKAVRIYVLCFVLFLAAFDAWVHARHASRPSPQRPTPPVASGNAERDAVLGEAWVEAEQRWQQRMIEWEARQARGRGHFYAALLAIPALLLLLATLFVRRAWPWSTLALLFAVWGALWPAEMLVTWLTDQTLNTSALLNLLHSGGSGAIVRLMMAWVLFLAARNELWKQAQHPVAPVFD